MIFNSVEIVSHFRLWNPGSSLTPVFLPPRAPGIYFALHSLRCSGSASLLPTPMLHKAGHRDSKDWPPMTPDDGQGWLLPRASSCHLMKPELVSLPCPLWRCLVLSCLVGTQSPKALAECQSFRQKEEKRNYPPQKNMTLSWIWTSFLLSCAYQKAWYCWFSNSDPSAPGGDKDSKQLSTAR